MSKLIYDGQDHTLMATDKDGNTLGSWVAYNNVDSHAALGHLPDGVFVIEDQIAPHAHPADPNGPYGSYGIIRSTVPGHVGVGVHSGRANARHHPGPEHPTMGCVRTTDAGMAAIKVFMRNDPGHQQHPSRGSDRKRDAWPRTCSAVVKPWRDVRF